MQCVRNAVANAATSREALKMHYRQFQMSHYAVTRAMKVNIGESG